MKVIKMYQLLELLTEICIKSKNAASLLSSMCSCNQCIGKREHNCVCNLQLTVKRHYQCKILKYKKYLLSQ